MASNSLIQTRVETDQAPPYAHGQLAYPGRPHRVRGYRNLDGGAAQVETLTVSAYSDGDTYTVEITWDGLTITETYTAVTADSDANGVASKLASQLNAHPDLRRLFEAEASSADVVLTGRIKGESFDVSVSAGGSAGISTTTTTSASSPGNIAYGKAILHDGFGTHAAQGKVAEALSTPRSIVITHGTGSSAQVVIGFEGELYEAEGATASALDTALGSALPTGLSVSRATNDVTIEVDTAGDDFELVSLTGDATLKTFTKGDLIDEELAGISCYTELTADSEGYAADVPVDVCEEGEVALSIASATWDDKLYIEMTGANAGTIYRSRDSNRVYCGRLHVTEARGNLAVVQVSPR